MARTQVTTREIGNVQRNDFDVITTGQAVIAKIISGTNITISSTGVDAGTGDVTINATALTVSAIGATPNANGATITAGVLTLQPADASFGGIVTTGTQTFTGNKTLANLTVTNILNGSFIASTNGGQFNAANSTSVPLKYKITNAGVDFVAPFWLSNSFAVTAGSIAVTVDNTNQLIFNVGNGANAIARAGIQVTNFVNTAGSESGDLIFLTQSGGTALSEKFRISSTGAISFNGPLLPNNLAGTSGQVLTSAGPGLVPTWTTPVTGSGSGVSLLSAVGTAPNANAATITGTTLNLQPADNTNPGVLTSIAQTIGGDKTITGNTAFQGLISQNRTSIVDNETQLSSTITVSPTLPLSNGNGMYLRKIYQGTAAASASQLGRNVSFWMQNHNEYSGNRTYNITSPDHESVHTAYYGTFGLGSSDNVGPITFNSGTDLKGCQYVYTAKIDLWPAADNGTVVKTYNGWYAFYGGFIDFRGGAGTTLGRLMYYTAGQVKDSTNVLVGEMMGYYVAPLKTANVTNAWGIYQEGISDKNYFGGNILIGSTIDNGSKLQVTGNITISGSTILNNWIIEATAFGVASTSLALGGSSLGDARVYQSVADSFGVLNNSSTYTKTGWLYKGITATAPISGSMGILANVAIKGNNVTANTGTLTNNVALYIESAGAGATNNYALWVDDGTSRFDGIVTLSSNLIVTGDAIFQNNLLSSSAASGSGAITLSNFTGSISYKNVFNQASTNITLANDATRAYIGNAFQNYAATAPIAGTSGLLVNVVIKGNTVTTGVGTVTNNAALYIESAGTGAANNYALWIDDGALRFDGALLANNNAGTSGQVLTSGGTGVVPTWTTPATAVGGTGGITRSISNITASTTAGMVANTDYVYFTTGAITLTLPSAIGNTNSYTIVHTDTATLTIATILTQNINFYPAAPAPTATVTVRGTVINLFSDGSNWWTI